MKKYNFDEVLTSLTDYTNENTGLVGTAVYNSPTFSSGIEILPGQPGDTVKLNIVDDDIYFQDNTCGFTTSGNTTFTQQSVSVCHLALREKLCPESFKSKWFGQLMSRGETPETFPFEELVLEHKTQNMGSEYEYIFWQGNTTSGTGNLSKCDGMISFLSGKTTNYIAAASGATTSSNAVSKVNTLILGLDERVLSKNVVFFTSMSNLNSYLQGLIAEKYYFPVGNTQNGVINVYGYPNIKIVGTSGLRGTTYWFGGTYDNFTFVTNLSKELQDIELLWNPYEKEIRLFSAGALGAGSAQPNLITHNCEII